MDATVVRTRIEAVWDNLPPVFTVHDILRLARMSKDQGRVVRGVLDGMVEDGRLYRSMVANQRLGRRPTAWSKDHRGGREEVLQSTIRAILPHMLVRFTIEELLVAVGMSQRMREPVQQALNQLVAQSVVMRVTDLPLTPGRRTDIWTADPRTIADEVSFRERKRLALMVTEDQAAQLKRMLQPWDPFAEGT